ncbi:MAG: indole-3-glycerol phosphate synthase TrpC, partial [Planctomycetota bacterium]
MTDRPLPPILGRIRATKEAEIQSLLAVCSEEAWLERARRTAAAEPPRPFRKPLTADARPPCGLHLIAEVKRASPSKGLIREDFDPPVLARAYAEGGATAISCLTDADYFRGDGAYVAAIRSAVALPVLRKDFLLHPAQVAEARCLGADAILLIARMLPTARLKDLLAFARELGMDILTEAHDPPDVERALEAGADLLGVNNRDLDTFTVDPATVERLRPLVPDGVPLVAESGIVTPED